MSRLRRVAQWVVIGGLVPGLGAPPIALAGAASLGTARGMRSVELSIDRGQSWMRLEGRSLPLVAGARLRSTTGVAMLDLAGGGRLTLLPFSAIEVRGASPAAPAQELVLDYGRLEVRQSAGGRVAVTTADARLAAAAGRPVVAEVFAGRGVTGVRVREGRVDLTSAGGDRRSVEAGAAPVFLPAPPAAQAAVFTSDAPVRRPSRARAVFTPPGENVGYVGPDGRLAVEPGFARDLAGPFPADRVARARARVPQDRRATAVVLLDVNGEYVGYVDGPIFRMVAAAPASSASDATLPAGARSGQEDPGLADWPWHYTLGLLAVVGGIGAIAAGVADSSKAASPGGP